MSAFFFLNGSPVEDFQYYYQPRLSCFLPALIKLAMARVLELSSAHKRLTSQRQSRMMTGGHGLDRAELEFCAPGAGIGGKLSGKKELTCRSALLQDTCWVCSLNTPLFMRRF